MGAWCACSPGTITSGASPTACSIPPSPWASCSDAAMAPYRNIVVLTGAVLSAESGLATFRDKDGIWAKYDYRQVATPEGFRANPQLVHDFYNQRRQGLKIVAPNAAHAALARLEHEHSGTVTVITQNIDPLHEV